MKKTLRFLTIAVMAGVALAACADKNKDDGGNNDLHEYPPVTISDKPGGAVKAGFADAIEIAGEGFSPEEDYIYVGYTDGEEIKYERVSPDVLTLRQGRVSFGVNITAAFLDKTIKVYLDRPGYDRMPITNDITFTMPTVAEGYIPDAAFRATLNSIHPQQGNPQIQPLFSVYGLLDVAAAATIEEINLYASAAASLEGIELFTGASRLIAHETSKLKVADFSKWKSSKTIFITMERSGALEEIIGGPSIGRLDCYDCASLTKVDLHHCRWTYNFQLYNGSALKSAVTDLDIRRQRTGTFKGGTTEGGAGWEYCSAEGDYTALVAGAKMYLPDNCHVSVDYQFLTDKWGGTGEDGTGYNCIYSAWKRGATVDVYDSQDITKKIGTVPMYSVDDDALTLTGDNNWTPTI